MEDAEKQRVLGELRAGHEALLHATTGLDDEVSLRKVMGEAWSILECVEHVVVTERYLLTRLQTATVADHPFEKWRREAKIAARAADRSQTIDAPEQARPRGRYADVAEAMAAFGVTRAEVMRWVENCAGDTRCMMTDHLLIEGPVTCAETLVMIAAHPARHAKQIEEIRERLGASAEQK